MRLCLGAVPIQEQPKKLTYIAFKEDWEPSQQYAVNNITHCQVQMLAHRKQGLVLPTLVIIIAPDPTTEKLRKRRSSRAATLVSGKETGPTTLWFRTEGEAYRLHEWARCIQAAAQTSIPENYLPMSPISPGSPSLASPSFNNPFVRQPRETVNFSINRPPSAPKSALHHKGSTATAATFSSRERPMTFSDTPSLRSRRSDLSSLTSSNPPTINTTHNFGVAIPADLPSPAMTPAGEQFGGLIEGWTSAQGRSSSLSSPSRDARDSMGSVTPFSPTPIFESGSPPFGRETILDRAFQLKCIPGSEQQMPGEEKLSSLARFEALMQQVDKQRQQKEHKARPPSMAPQYELKSAWGADEDSDDQTSDADSDETEEDSAAERDHQGDGEIGSIRPESRRAFEARRGGPQTPSQSPRSRAGPRSPILFNSETLSALNTGSTLGRSAGQRLHQHTLSGLANMSLSVERPSYDGSPGRSSIMSGATSVHEETGGLNPSAAYRTSTISESQQRNSLSSSHGSKRLSFTEFTERLSSTSSMLLVQSNVEHADPPIPSRRSSIQPRGPVSVFLSPKIEVQQDRERGEKCKNWRNSVGMFGPDGAFL